MNQEHPYSSRRSKEEIQEDLKRIQKETHKYGIKLREAMDEGMPDESPEEFEELMTKAFSVRAELERVEREMKEWELDQ